MLPFVLVVWGGDVKSGIYLHMAPLCKPEVESMLLFREKHRVPSLSYASI